MFDLKHTDDQKRRWQSHEYQYDAVGAVTETFYTVSTTGYGKDKKEAAQELHDSLVRIRNEIDEAINQLKEEL